MAIDSKPVRGTKDFLPQEVVLRDAVQSVILDTYRSYGFQRINTPVMEDIDRLTGSDGGENLSLIFKILKRGQKLNLEQENLQENDLADSGLRYDLTLPLSRYYANNRHHLMSPFKCIQIDKVFRAERPQKGRLREFYQCDIDIIGDSSVNSEIELIYVTSKALLNIGFDDFTIRINDRRILADLIVSSGFSAEDVSSVCIVFDKLDKVGTEGVQQELLEKGYDDAVVSTFIANISSDNTIEAIEKICSNSEVIADVKKVINDISSLSQGKFNIVYDKSLVRGMGYYTGMIFEIVSSKFSSSVAGGGRYDKMIGRFLNEDVPAVGFSIGFERICEILKETNSFIKDTSSRVAMIYDASDNYTEVLSKSEELRQEGFVVATYKRGKKLGKQLDSLLEQGFTHSYIFNESTEVKALIKR